MSYMKVKMLSSLEKCFLDDSIYVKPEKKDFAMFANERLSFQVAVYNESEVRPKLIKVCLEGALAPYAEVRRVVNIPSEQPADLRLVDENYLRTEPGLYPDLLRPMHFKGCFFPPYHQVTSLWISVRLPEGFAAGEYDLTVSLDTIPPSNAPETPTERLESLTAKIRVLSAKLPPQKLIHTEWFHTDCLASAYHTEVFSEQHWRAIENFMRTAVDNGINMILTPVFTPELDTYIGGERLTTQLVGITVERGEYSFDFTLLDRWIDLSLKVGVEYYEIPPFFTQWGAKNAPKIVATVNGEEKRIFGWETDALGEEYAAFLDAFLPALLKKLKERGIDRRCYFHVSDEPSLEQLDHYKKCRELIGKHLGEYPVIDALSHYDFYEMGCVDKPVAFTGQIDEFLKHNVSGLWAYYCGGGGGYRISNRFFAMSQARVRVLGVQLWLYRIEGFLHWGYNFYNNYRSYDPINPFGCSDGEWWNPSGDMFVVYPGDGEQAWESIRLNAMREAMDDMRALSLCEELRGREFTEKLVMEGTDGVLSFTHYPNDAAYLIDLREKIVRAIEGEQI